MEGSAMLIQEAKKALAAPGDAESQQRLAQVNCDMTFYACCIKPAENNFECWNHSTK